MRPNATFIDSLKFYANFARLYDNMAALSTAFPSPTLTGSLLSAHFDPSIDRILDVGIGTGLSSKVLAEEGYAITGVDGSRAMLDLCAEKNIAWELVQTDFTRSALPFSLGEFDAAFSTNTLYLLPEQTQERIIDELHRVTRPGGYYAFNYEPRKPGDLAVRFNDATTDFKNPCVVGTYSMWPERVRTVLSVHDVEIVEADVRTVAKKQDGYPIVFETLVCQKLG